MLNEHIFRELPDAEDQRLRDLYGAPSPSNQKYVAANYAEAGDQLVYSSAENCFLSYDSQTGLWLSVRRESLLCALGCFCHWLATLLGMPKLDDTCTSAFLGGVIDFLRGLVTKSEEVFVNKVGQHIIHCANVMLVFDMERGWVPTPFSPDFYSRNALPIAFLRGAKAPRFLDKLLKPAVLPEDIELLQLYFGQCLLGENLSQQFLVMTGRAGSGKSTLVNVVEGILGRQNCVEFRSAHADGRFELGRLVGKKLLTAKDVGSEFLLMSGARKIKSLTGDDMLSIEFKNCNMVLDIQGNFNLIVTGNSMLRINIEGDVDAWKRRLLWVPFMGMPPKERIVKFDKALLAQEGSGILNWMLAGAAKLLRAGGVITLATAQRDRVHELLELSRPFDCFAAGHIFSTPSASITTEEAVTCFGMFCKRKGWPSIPEREAQQLFNDWMRRQGAIQRTDIKRNGHNKRGYSSYQIDL